MSAERRAVCQGGRACGGTHCGIGARAAAAGVRQRVRDAEGAEGGPKDRSEAEPTAA